MITAPSHREEPNAGPERQQVEGWLEFHRATLLTKCADLTDEQLKQRPVATSTLSLLGLLRHMTIVELWWFEIALLGQGTVADLPFTDPADGDSEFAQLDNASVDDVVALFHEACDRARAAAATMALDDLVAPRGEDLEAMAEGSSRPTRDLRWIYLHMIEEYARHNGHADLLREMIDGRTGL